MYNNLKKLANVFYLCAGVFLVFGLAIIFNLGNLLNLSRYPFPHFCIVLFLDLKVNL